MEILKVPISDFFLCCGGRGVKGLGCGKKNAYIIILAARRTSRPGVVEKNSN